MFLQRCVKTGASVILTVLVDQINEVQCTLINKQAKQ